MVSFVYIVCLVGIVSIRKIYPRFFLALCASFVSINSSHIKVDRLWLEMS